MAAWGAFAITIAVLIAWSLWRLARVSDRTVWWPGLGMFLIAAVAMLVLVADGGYGSVLAVFGGVILASDVVLLGSVLVTSLCSRPAERSP